MDPLLYSEYLKYIFELLQPIPRYSRAQPLQSIVYLLTVTKLILAIFQVKSISASEKINSN